MSSSDITERSAASTRSCTSTGSRRIRRWPTWPRSSVARIPLTRRSRPSRRGRGDPRWDKARSLSERPETARGVATAARRALRLLPEEGGGKSGVTLRHVGFTPVPPGLKPGFDHADTYLTRTGNRLYVAHTGADRVDVLDCRSGAYIGAITDLPGVAGVLIDSEQDLLFTSDRTAGRVSRLRCSDQTPIDRVPVRPRPNALAYDRRFRRLFSFNLGDPAWTNCTASVIPVAERRSTTTIVLPGLPRWPLCDDATRSVYVNIAEPATIGVIEADVLMMSGTIPIPAAGPHGLAIVPEE